MPTRLTIQQYADEILGDLDELKKMYPEGIYVANLVDYYGESAHRTVSAIKLLEQQERAVVARNAARAIFIPAVDLFEELKLSGVQQRLVRFLTDLCLANNTDRVRTNYSQLARVLDASYGGIRSSIQRLEDLEYIKIDSPSSRGRQNELILILTRKASR